MPVQSIAPTRSSMSRVLFMLRASLSGPMAACRVTPALLWEAADRA